MSNVSNEEREELLKKYSRAINELRRIERDRKARERRIKTPIYLQLREADRVLSLEFDRKIILVKQDIFELANQLSLCFPSKYKYGIQTKGTYKIQTPWGKIIEDKV